MPDALITTEALTKKYPGGVTALDGLSVEVGVGVIGLVGANGAGKSTLIKILLGLLPATSGRATVLDLDTATQGSKIRELVGYMPEHDCLPPDVSATELVSHLARVSGLPAGAARERTADVLRHVGLYEERYRQIGGYSTGMKQRVKLAQALVHDPRLLFLDEPTNGLDPAGRDEMLALIERIGRDFGITTIVASHLLGEIERIAGWLIAIDAGKLLRTAPLATFTERTGQLLVETEEEADPLAARLTARGLDAQASGRTLLIDLASADGTGGEFAAYDAVRDEAVALDLALVRIEHRRHQLEDLFRDDEPAGADERVA
jgi:ABC-2 type transport system ATP-binding protein